MKWLTLLAMSTVVLATTAPVAAQDAASLRAAIETHYAAIHTGDVDGALRHHLPEFTWFISDGRPLLESGAMQAAERMSAALDFGTANLYMSHFSAQIYGDVGIATFYLVGTHSWGGETKNGTWRVTGVWVRQGSEWREAHHHESPLLGEIHP